MKPPTLVLCMALSGCASFPQFAHMAKDEPRASVSYVSMEISSPDSEAVARDMAAFLATQLPPAKTTIELEPVQSMFHEALVYELSLKGFGVVESEDDQAVPVRYFVTGLDGGILVRIRYQGILAGRYYGRLPAGQLSFANAFSVREVTQ